MSTVQVKEWFDAFGSVGYLVGFLLPFIEAFVPILPLIVFVIVNVNVYGFVVGMILAWLGTVLGSFIMFLIFRKLSNSKYMKRLKKRKSAERLIKYIDDHSFIPIFILFCFPFTPSALVNLIASVSNIKSVHYLWVLTLSKLVMISLVGWLGKDISTLFTNPLRITIVAIIVIVVWFGGRKLEKHFMHSTEE
ncbi:TVP38/TMEM64 family protein [Staphylococcus durrellii]|uniref:TVP38/TMEM64 family protein n=1 Tax=Staphylococcus durrellii TaxID=2781773 RepID=UPI00189FE93C|nr:TVP38/TMEM64 family protein [Staphylococcus durrellii]MBF7017523.1 TVP38/TMEM64 family protein [Staphylococcus durrellii]